MCVYVCYVRVYVRPFANAPAGACLSCLGLAHNRLTARGAAALAAAARRPGCSLTDVDLGHNAQVGEAGERARGAWAWGHGWGVGGCEVWGYRVGNAGVGARAAPTHPPPTRCHPYAVTFTRLDCCCLPLHPLHCASTSSLTQRNATPLTAAGARAWAEVLTSPGGGCRLRRLVLSGCEVPDAGAYCLGAALKGNGCLAELGLAENHISTRGAGGEGGRGWVWVGVGFGGTAFRHQGQGEVR